MAIGLRPWPIWPLAYGLGQCGLKAEALANIGRKAYGHGQYWPLGLRPWPTAIRPEAMANMARRPEAMANGH